MSSHTLATSAPPADAEQQPRDETLPAVVRRRRRGQLLTLRPTAVAVIGLTLHEAAYSIEGVAR
ncbi:MULTISPECIES: hypothetical protein [Streptomyces]|uniref:Uncharacterized protein n=1 Tax=Streptomyces sp. NBC_00093 TaxID=2975649 RepID=A0AAU2A8Z0_9ACTN